MRRLTSLGPLVEDTTSDVPPPQFKTKTFKWDKVYMRFQTTGGSLTMDKIENPGGRGVERGSSFSLDGAYNDHRGLTPDGYSDYVTLIYELDRERDMPFFYINPRLSKDPMTVDDRDIVMEAPGRLTEAEVAVKSPLDPQDAIGAVVTITEDEIREMGEERGLDDLQREQMESSIDKVRNIKQNFTQLDKVPETEFRKTVRDVADIIDDMRRKDDWHRMEKEMRGVHQVIADSYGIDYNLVKQRAEGRM